MLTRQIFPILNNVEAHGFIADAISNKKDSKSESNFQSFFEKFVVAVSVIFYATGNAQEAYERKNNFPSNGILMQMINSVLPFVISNLYSCLSMLNHVDKNQELLLQYQRARNDSSKAVLFNRYQLLLKIGFRIAFSDNLEIAKKLEPEFINLITQLYFSGKTFSDLNQSLNSALDFLQENPAPTQYFWKGLFFALFALAAMVVASFGAYFIPSKHAFAITGIIAASIVAFIILVSHGAEHTTYITDAIKKQKQDALKVVDDAEKDIQKLIDGVYSQLLSEERKHLNDQVEQLTSFERSILLDKNPRQEYIPPPISNATQEITWSFFKHMGRQVGENAWRKAKRDYQDELQTLVKAFNDVRKVLQTQKSVILSLLPNDQEIIDSILDPKLNLEVSANTANQELQTLLLRINKANVVNDYILEIENSINTFKNNYLRFQNSQKVYNATSEDMNYLQQPTIVRTL